MNIHTFEVVCTWATTVSLCPKGIGYNEVVPDTRSGASYKEIGPWSTGYSQAVILV
jgi:hypothetical protein